MIKRYFIFALLIAVLILSSCETTEKIDDFPLRPKKLVVNCYFAEDSAWNFQVSHSLSVLDNAERRLVTDGYYATPYWQERDGKVFFNAITYRGIGCHLPENMDFPVDPGKPDIVRLEYLWDEIR